MENQLTIAGKGFHLANSIAYQADGIVSKKIIQEEKGNITLFAFDESQKLSEHSAPFDAFVQILDGDCEIIIGGNVNMLKTGDCIIMPANVPHAVNATTPFKMLLTMIRK